MGGRFGSFYLFHNLSDSSPNANNCRATGLCLLLLSWHTEQTKTSLLATEITEGHTFILSWSTSEACTPLTSDLIIPWTFSPTCCARSGCNLEHQKPTQKSINERLHEGDCNGPLPSVLLYASPQPLLQCRVKIRAQVRTPGVHADL